MRRARLVPTSQPRNTSKKPTQHTGKMMIPHRESPERPPTSRAGCWRRSLKVATFSVFWLLALSHPPLWEAAGQWGRPGTESRELTGLEPKTRERVAVTLSRLAAEGWPVRIRATKRDATRQAYYYEKGWTQTRQGPHLKGEAADLQLALPWALFPLHVAFAHRLREVAEAEGLCSGGAWRRQNRLWALFDLGWDPFHIERCSGSG